MEQNSTKYLTKNVSLLAYIENYISLNTFAKEDFK